MRVLVILVIVAAGLLGHPATAASQSLTVAGCVIHFSTVGDIVDPKDKATVVGVQWRRSDGLPVEVRCPDVQIYAQEIDYWSRDERLELRGQVVFQQGGTRIAAELGTVDLKTRNGAFETATGTLQLTDRQIDRTLFGSMEPEAYFTAARIEKVGPQKYTLTDAVFSTCVQPTRRWQILTSKMSFTVDRYAIMRNARLEVKDVPLLYLPVFYYPIREDDRATGFLMPTYGSSTLRGFTLSNAFFWAINRSQDLTIYHDWFSRSGQGVGADYRYVGHGGSSGSLRFHVINERAVYDTTDPSRLVSPAKRSYNLRGNLTQLLPGRIRVQGMADFFTDAATQQLYQTDLSVFSRRTRFVRLDASGQWGRLRASAQAERNDIFYGTTTTSYRTQPRFTLSVSPSTIGNTRVYVGGSFDALSMARIPDLDRPTRRDDIFRTDANVTIRAPYSLGAALELDGQVSVRRTDWNAHRDPDTGQRVEEPLSRTLLEARVSMRGPVFSRVFNTTGNRWVERVKHLIEPAVTVMRRTPFERFDDVIAFDSSIDSIVGGLTQVSYGLTNRLLARVRQREGESVVRQLAGLEISQRYYTDQRAATYDQRTTYTLNPDGASLPPASNFSPVTLALTLTPSPTVAGTFGLDYDTRFRAVRGYRASALVTQPWLDLNSTWTKQPVIAGLPGYATPQQWLSLSTRLRKPSGGASVAYTTAVDITNDRFLQHRFGFFYNAQCCGVSVDYVVVNLSHYGQRNNKVFSVSFNLAGIGSFVNPLGVFGNNGRQ